jgi:hypothetical protein
MQWNSRAHSLRGRGMRCLVQRLVQVNMFFETYEVSPPKGWVWTYVVWWESWTRPARRGLLEDRLYQKIRSVSSALWLSLGHTPRAWRARYVSWCDFHEKWIRSRNICSVIHTMLNAWTSLGDKWWWMCYICYFLHVHLPRLRKSFWVELTMKMSVIFTTI